MPTASAEPLPATDAAEPSVVRAFVALVLFSFRRTWRVRQMGWVALGLLAILAATVGVVTYGPIGWNFRTRLAWVADRNSVNGVVAMTHARYAEERLTMYEAVPGPPDLIGVKFLLLSPLRAMLKDEPYLADWQFLNFSKWVVFGMYLGFLLPLFTLAYASGAIGGEREGRTMIWLFTRPLPRWAVYLAKFLGVLPWCVVASGLGLAALGAAGGSVGRHAVETYWPAALAGTIAFSALFHLIGALFRRPAVVGLVYVFFFETLVANLPGSLKQLSLNYYVRSLMYNEATREARSTAPASLDVYAPATPDTAWLMLMGAAVAFTVVGMVLFGWQEPTEEI